MSNTNFLHITDENLFQLCRTYGTRSLEWRNKFIGLLPEVNRRKLYEKKGFSSIFEFAAKLAGVSRDQLCTVLNLEKKFEGKPLLKKLLVTGEVSVNKLARVAAIATNENEELLASQVKLLSKSALETFVRDEKRAEKNANHQMLTVYEDGLFETHNAPKSLPGQELQLSPEVKLKLLELQQKGININELLLQFLDKREQEIAEEKAQIAKKMSKKIVNKPSRYLPKKVREILQKEHGTKCSISTCQKLATQKHHTQRFAIAVQEMPTLVHDPHYLAPLCRDHHVIAHTIDVKFQQVRQKAFG